MSGAGNCCVSPQAGRASPCKMSKFGQYDPDAASATSAMPVEGHGHRIIFFPAGEFKYRSATGIELVRMCVHCTSHIYIYIILLPPSFLAVARRPNRCKLQRFKRSFRM